MIHLFYNPSTTIAQNSKLYFMYIHYDTVSFCRAAQEQALVLQELLDIFNDIIPKIQQCLNAINKLWEEKEVPPRGDGHSPSEEGDAPHRGMRPTTKST